MLYIYIINYIYIVYIIKYDISKYIFQDYASIICGSSLIISVDLVMK